MEKKKKVYEKDVPVLVLSVSFRDWVCSLSGKTMKKSDHVCGCLLGHWDWTAGEQSISI